jgi:hypothetical protein
MVDSFFQKIAGLFGYPENPGMPTIYDLPNESYARSKFLDNLPSHQTFWPPIQRPETWFEMIFGPSPKVDQFQDISMKAKKKDFIIFILKIIKIFIFYLIGSQNFFKYD